MQKFLVGLVVVLLLAGAAGFLVLTHQSRTMLDAATSEAEQAQLADRQAAAAVARELAEDMARMLSAVLADDIAQGNLEAVEAQLATAVQGNRLAGVLVVAVDGTVLTSTDLRYRGRTLHDDVTRRALAATEVAVLEEPPAPGQIEVDAPLMAGGSRIGVLRVFVQLDDLAGV
jgi:hypothetical protein